MIPPRATVREILDPAPGLPGALFLRLDGPGGPRAPGRFPLALAAGERLSADAWFNHFPLPWWRAHGAPGALSLEVEAEGRLNVALRAQGPEGPARTLAVATLEGGGPVSIPVPPEAAGRLWAEFAAEGPTLLRGARWQVEAAARPVRLALGLVTFGREAELAATLEEALAETPAGTRIWLVNQGAAFGPGPLQALVGDPRVTLIEQANLGGCGGFARCMVEALAAAEADPEDGPTHLLMMDDDIRLDGRMIAQATRQLAFLRQDAALGGAMLDLRQPTRVHEAGATVARHGVIRPVAQGADLATPEGLAPFAGAQPGGFNGWWFFAAPLAKLREAGLTPPLFLRGDDLDLSARLAAVGAPTVTPPGLSVWHEPFYAKATSWQHYYDLRNRLIHQALHAPGDPVPALDLLERLLTPALSQDYATAEWRMLALRHFLAGPGALFARAPQEIHAEATALAPGLRPQPLARVPDGLRRIERARRGGVARFALDYAGAVLAGLVPRRRVEILALEKAATPATVGGRAHVRSDAAGSWAQLYTPRPLTMLAQLGRALALAGAYALRGRAAAAAWRAGIEAHRAPEAWARLFGSAK